MSTREFILNCLLLAVIAFLAYSILTLEPESHQAKYTEADIDKLKARIDAGEVETIYTTGGPTDILSGTETIYAGAMPPETFRRDINVEEQFPDYFRQPMFDPLIPTTPPPTPPPPTPTPTPDLEQAVSGRWQFQYCFGREAAWNDTQTNEFFTLKIGETRHITWGRYEMDIRLHSIDEQNFTATVDFEDQQYVFKPY